MSRRRRRAPLPSFLASAVALALAVLLAGCAAPVRGMQGGMHARGGQRMSMPHRTSACPSPAPRLRGAVVHVHLMDMGHGGMMGGRSVMRLMAAPSVVAHGDVTFVATNLGRRTHELVVLPVPTGSSARLPVDGSGKVSERGALGEASAPCAAGTGEGLKPGTTGWVTLALRPGRYELVCNEPHHYARGMHAVLVVH
jgi:uncharacterized cupredoxin-like copper-binding protein